MVNHSEPLLDCKKEIADRLAFWRREIPFLFEAYAERDLEEPEN